ncbi:phd-finger domain-containing protein [Apiospora saccharicola]
MPQAAANRLHSVEEQQAALNLSQLAQSTDGIGQLINAMVSEASPDVVALMAQGDASRIANANLNSADVKALEVMLAQVEALKKNISKTLDSTRAGAVSSEPDASKNAKSNSTEDSMQLD